MFPQITEGCKQNLTECLGDYIYLYALMTSTSVEVSWFFLLSFCLHNLAFQLFLHPNFCSFFVWLTIAALLFICHSIHTDLYVQLNTLSKQLWEGIIFIHFNPTLHLNTFRSLQNCRGVPTIATLPFFTHSALPLVCRLNGWQVTW